MVWSKTKSEEMTDGILCGVFIHFVPFVFRYVDHAARICLIASKQDERRFKKTSIQRKVFVQIEHQQKNDSSVCHKHNL